MYVSASSSLEWAKAKEAMSYFTSDTTFNAIDFGANSTDFQYSFGIIEGQSTWFFFLKIVNFKDHSGILNLCLSRLLIVLQGRVPTLHLHGACSFKRKEKRLQSAHLRWILGESFCHIVAQQHHLISQRLSYGVLISFYMDHGDENVWHFDPVRWGGEPCV